ncbi:hypothetical protein GXP67_05105 [Rhodocytophaga rosea]|uniref:Uncharacterized protein n=1 Tax=Rhodocytophaga rosea TaxID=2704465 RepID=A0A6C0GDK6_9BACT|nr:hypothetical protein [Rhodocytophaga rosea]QHT66089.1 hypothetical protein GXP67_05105 [Rhodocytophaga rosea]
MSHCFYLFNKYYIFLWLLIAGCLPAIAQDQALVHAEKSLLLYHQSLDSLRRVHTNVKEMPDLHFFLFGMGDRHKMIYRGGKLIDAATGDVLKRWKINKELIVPSEYLVYLETEDGRKIRIIENGKGVYIWDGNKVTVASESKLNLPTFEGQPYAPVLRVLHHEILINIHNGLPLPNFLVYKKARFRDAALMAMVLQQTDNLHLIKDWILAIRDPFDRHNQSMSEADNLGQVLYLVSLVSGKEHPVVKMVLDSVQQFGKENYIEGKTGDTLHPVFQTKWIKYGFHSLGLHDPYQIPAVYDSYSSLFWWDFKQPHVGGNRFDKASNQNYPYLVWAEDHFFGEAKGRLTNRYYPLSWEAQANDAYYPGMQVLNEILVKDKVGMPHSWHAAEMFLLLKESK